MTTKEALKLAPQDVSQEVWNEIEATLVKAGLCPSCAEEGETVKLCKYEPPTHETYGGRMCPTCECFWVAQGQRGNMERNEPDYGGAFDGVNVMSDADPGL